MRIGILTYHFSNNYGALMQAYGLRKWLEGEGHQAEIVNYHPAYVEDGGDFDRPFDPRLWKKNLTILYLKLSALRRALFGNQEQVQAFEQFRQQEFHLAGERLLTAADVERYLAEQAVPYDMLVCGSDQIWRPSIQKGFDPVYFLAVKAPGNLRRVSYAPSFGDTSVAEPYRAEIVRLLAGLDAISLREPGAAEFVSALTGRDAICVPDPTVLYGDFTGFVEEAEPVPAGHVFCYALCSDVGIRDVAEAMGARLKAPVLSPYNALRRWREIGTTVYPSPKGWAAMIAKAGCVVTNSFHGTVFSILMRRPFLTVGFPPARRHLNKRVLNILGELGLHDRFVAWDEIESAIAKLTAPIDWDAVEQNQKRLQAAGRHYLRRECGECQP